MTNFRFQRNHVALVIAFLFFLIEPTSLFGEPTKLVVAYASASASYCPLWIAKQEGFFRKYDLQVEPVLMQGASTYMPALSSGNIQVVYGGGTAVSRAIAAGSFDLIVIATETRYVPLRLMVIPSIRNPSELKGKRIGVGRAGLDEYAMLLYLQKLGLVPGQDVRIVYLTGGVTARAASLEQGLIDAVTVTPPNEYGLEKAGFRQLANFLDFKMPYAGVPHTVTRTFRDQNRKVLADYTTAVVAGMRLFQTNKEAGYRAITQLTRQTDPVLLERTYDSLHQTI